MADQKASALTEISVPALEDLLYTVDDPSGVPVSNKLTSARFLGTLLNSTCTGRLTTQSAVGLSTADRTAQGTIYFTPWHGNKVSLYDGTRWKMFAFNEVSLALTATSGNNYDVFLYDSSGTLTLELSAAWASATARTDALDTQDGVLIKDSDPTRRYLGTIRASGANVTEDSAAKRFIWNLYNRVHRSLIRQDDTNSWTYTTDTWRQAGANASNQVEYVVGQGDVDVEIQVQVLCDNGSAGRYASVGIGIDSTSTNSALLFGGTTVINANITRCVYRGYPGLGYRTLVWLERAQAGVGTTTWYGDANVPTNFQSGMVGMVWG